MTYLKKEIFNMRLKFLLDTNICIYIIKKKPATVLRKFEQLSPGEIAMSMVTFGELLYSALKSQFKTESLKKINHLSTLIPVLPLSNEVASHYGQIRSSLERVGKPIGNNDLWIASHAHALEIILVTNNTKEFKRVPNLKIENWA